jgi:hypothetical protein
MSRMSSRNVLTATRASAGAARTSKIGRPHLGDRVVIKAALTPQELGLLDLLRGDVERSVFLGVLLMEHVGRHDLLPKPEQLSLVDSVLDSGVGDLVADGSLDDISIPPARTQGRRSRSFPGATVRVHPEVRDELERLRKSTGLAQCQYNADVIRVRLGLEPRHKPTGEAMPLAI